MITTRFPPMPMGAWTLGDQGRSFDAIRWKAEHAMDIVCIYCKNLMRAVE